MEDPKDKPVIVEMVSFQYPWKFGQVFAVSLIRFGGCRGFSHVLGEDFTRTTWCIYRNLDFRGFNPYQVYDQVFINNRNEIVF